MIDETFWDLYMMGMVLLIVLIAIWGLTLPATTPKIKRAAMTREEALRIAEELENE